MRDFNSFEKNIITALIDPTDGHIPSIESILNEFFFTDELGRALIIRANLEYAYFYIKTKIFDDDSEKNSALQQFLDLILFLNYLKKEGYISFHHGHASPIKPLYILNNTFDAPSVENDTIILNAKGDYTSQPNNTIQDIDNTVIYKGVLFKGDMFKTICATMTGNLIISSQLKQFDTKKDLVKELLSIANNPPSNPSSNTIQRKERIKQRKNATPQKEKHFFQWLSVGIASLLIIGGLLTYFYHKHQINHLHSDNISLKKNLDSLKQQKKQIAQSKVYYGIDISHYNGNEVSLLTKEDSITFVIIKATEGVTYEDPDFSNNWDLVEDQKYILGAYHFYRTNDDPDEQVNFYWNTLKSKGTPDIAPIVDIENGSIPTGTSITTQDLQTGLISFLETLTTVSGRIPMIYTNLDFANQYLNNPDFSKYPLWLAEYNNKTEPELPETWKTKGYTIWQKSDSYTIESIATDYDIYDGNLIKLIK